MYDKNSTAMPSEPRATHADRIADLQMRVGNIEIIHAQIVDALAQEAGIRIPGLLPPPMANSLNPVRSPY